MSDQMVQTSTTPCPTCIERSVVKLLKNRPGFFATYCDAGHQFPDSEDLKALVVAAKQKYPQFYSNPQVPPPPQDPEVVAKADVVINAETKRLIEKMTGQTVTGGSDIKGIVYDLTKDLETTKMELVAARGQLKLRTGSTGPAAGQIGITIPEWAVEAVNEQASHEGVTIEHWLQTQIDAYMETFFSHA